MWHAACRIHECKWRWQRQCNTKLQMHSIDRIFRWVHVTADKNSWAPHPTATKTSDNKNHTLNICMYVCCVYVLLQYEGSKQIFLLTFLACHKSVWQEIHKAIKRSYNMTQLELIPVSLSKHGPDYGWQHSITNLLVVLLRFSQTTK